MAQTDPYSSKHNDNFNDRTLLKRLEIETALNKLRLQLTQISRYEDENSLDDLYIRVMLAIKGFEEGIIRPRQEPSENEVWYYEEAKQAAMATAQMAIRNDWVFNLPQSFRDEHPSLEQRRDSLGAPLVESEDGNMVKSS